jgi:hypothetical protein
MTGPDGDARAWVNCTADSAPLLDVSPQVWAAELDVGPSVREAHHAEVFVVDDPERHRNVYVHTVPLGCDANHGRNGAPTPAKRAGRKVQACPACSSPSGLAASNRAVAQSDHRRGSISSDHTRSIGALIIAAGQTDTIIPKPTKAVQSDFVQ